MIWTLLGVGVGVAGAFCILAGHALSTFPELDAIRHYVAGAFAAIGILVWVAGWRKKHGKETHEHREDEPVSLGLDAQYWGAMLVVMGGIALFIQPLFRPQQATVVVAARTPKKEEPPPPAPEPPPPPPVVTNAPFTFPKVKLQGVILRNGSATVIISGDAYAVGDDIAGARIVEIKREGILLEHASEKKFIPLE